MRHPDGHPVLRSARGPGNRLGSRSNERNESVGCEVCVHHRVGPRHGQMGIERQLGNGLVREPACPEAKLAAFRNRLRVIAVTQRPRPTFNVQGLRRLREPGRFRKVEIRRNGQLTKRRTAIYLDWTWAAPWNFELCLDLDQNTGRCCARSAQSSSFAPQSVSFSSPPTAIRKASPGTIVRSARPQVPRLTYRLSRSTQHRRALRSLP